MSASILALFNLDKLFRKSTPGQGEHSELDAVDEYYAARIQEYIDRFATIANHYKDPALELLQGAGNLLWLACQSEPQSRKLYSDLIDLNPKPHNQNPTLRMK